MAVSTKENGKIIRWKDQASSSGLMAESTMVNMSMTRKREWEPSIGKNIIDDSSPSSHWVNSTTF